MITLERRLKETPGEDMHAVGGATLVSTLMNASLVDEIRLVVQPVVLRHHRLENGGHHAAGLGIDE